MSKIEVEGLDELRRKLGNIKVNKITKQALSTAGLEILSDVRPYPTQPAPKNPNYQYLRGTGTMYVPTGRIQKTSEDMRSKWYIKTRPKQVSIGNLTKYAKWVHGDNRGENQARIHTRTGWKVLVKTGEQKLPEITRAIQREIDRAWRQ